MIEGSGSILQTSGSGCGSRRPKTYGSDGSGSATVVSKHGLIKISSWCVVCTPFSSTVCVQVAAEVRTSLPTLRRSTPTAAQRDAQHPDGGQDSAQGSCRGEGEHQHLLEWASCFILALDSRVADPYSFGSRSGSNILCWILIRIQGFWWPKIEKKLQLKKFFFVWTKTTIYLSLGLHKRTSKLQKKPSAFIRIRIHLPDWVRIQFGSGSATLLDSYLVLARIWFLRSVRASNIFFHQNCYIPHGNAPVIL